MSDAAVPLVVLIADANPGDVLLIKDALEQIDGSRSVHVATDGQEAIAFLRRTSRFTDAPRPDLVLLDLNLPRTDGRQTLVEIKSDEQLRSIPVIVFTRSQDPVDIDTSYAAHANAYVTKPLDPGDLLDIIGAIEQTFTRIATLPSRPPPAS